MDNDQMASGSGRIARRDVLRSLGVLGAAAIAGPSILAACGGDNSGSSGGTTTAPSGGATTAASGGATTTGAAASSGNVGQELLDALGLKAGPELGGGKTWQMGSVLALTGNGSFYGKTMGRGIDLAVAHIKAAGGPDIKVVYKDHKSGDPQAGVQAMTELGTSGIPAKLASYGDDILAMLPLTQQYKCLTLDGGGANGGAGQSQDFFWGCRALPGLDVLPGLFRYLQEAYPDAKTIGLTGWDLGAQLNADGKRLFTDALKGTKLQFNNLFELAAPNSTDFSNVLTKIKDNEPDILIVASYGQDPGFFLDQSQTANLNAKIVGYEFTPDGLNASKGAFDSVGWTFSSDYFDVSSAQSKLATLFVREFKAKYGDTPDFYAANYYEDALGMWDLVRRVLAKGGNINSGVDLQSALKDKPELASVYGGDATTVGTFAMDPNTHSVVRRQMGVFEYKGGKVTTLALFNIGGADYKKM
jgi:ABC-type branched-subunit amino acid transport system substrate-binding protein